MPMCRCRRLLGGEVVNYQGLVIKDTRGVQLLRGVTTCPSNQAQMHFRHRDTTGRRGVLNWGRRGKRTQTSWTGQPPWGGG